MIFKAAFCIPPAFLKTCINGLGYLYIVSEELHDDRILELLDCTNHHWPLSYNLLLYLFSRGRFGVDGEFSERQSKVNIFFYSVLALNCDKRLNAYH